jgi:hypothetical protein
MKKLLALAFLLPSVAYAAPAKIPNLALCAQANGTLVVKQRCSASETKLSLSAIAAQGQVGSPGPKGEQGPEGIQGPKGEKGADGIPGFVDPSACITRTNEFNTTVRGLSVTVECNIDEFLMTHGIEPNDNDAYISRIELRYQPGTNFPQGVRYNVLRPAGVTGTTLVVLARAVCCQF